MARDPLNRMRSRGTAKAVSFPSPVGGWNTRDALDEMPATDAIVLDNWFPTTGKCVVRNGYTEHSSGVGSGDVDFLGEYHAGATRKLLAASGTNIYDATSSTASSLGSGFTSGQWQHVNFSGYMFLVNGEDSPQEFDGSTLSASTFTGSGLTPSDLIGVNVFKNRLFFWEKDSQDFWYASVDAVSGALTKFPLSRVGQFGGNLLTMETWTLDSGSGIDDLAVFIMTSGEVIVYQGTDPGSASDWAMIGVFQIGRPINIRGAAKVGGDIMIATYDDYVSLGTVLKTGQIGNSSKLSGAVTEAAQSNGSSFGWQAILYRKGNMLVFNVPQSDGTFDQHVINTITGAACRFLDIPSRSWTVYNGDLYFGSSDGKVYQADYGDTDNGDAIDADAKQAWTDLKSANRKRLSAVRPALITEGVISYELGVGYDFRDALTATPTASTVTGPLWDVALWDAAYWAGENQVDLSWKVKGGTGQNFSTRLRVSAKQSVSWLRTDYRAELGVNL